MLSRRRDLSDALSAPRQRWVVCGEAGAVTGVPALFLALYTYAWFIGFVVSGALYWGLSLIWRPCG